MNILSLIHPGIKHITEEPSFFSADRLLVIIAIAVSLLGLIISVRYNRKTLKMTESHNKKATRPALNLHREFIDNVFIIEVSNSGLGPAILTKMEFYYQNQTFHNLEELLTKIIPNYLASTIPEECLITVFDNKEVLAIGSKQNIYKSKLNNETIFNNLRSALLKTEIKIDYESVYGEALKLNSFIYQSY
jgi:hypothetical protein